MVDIQPRSGGEPQVKEDSPVPAMKVTAMPGKHVPPGLIGKINDLLRAVKQPCSSLRTQADNNTGSANKWLDARTRIRYLLTNKLGR